MSTVRSSHQYMYPRPQLEQLGLKRVGSGRCLDWRCGCVDAVSAARAHGFPLEPAHANHRLALGAARVRSHAPTSTAHAMNIFFFVVVLTNNSGVGSNI
jgi:hypothetical protein